MVLRSRRPLFTGPKWAWGGKFAKGKSLCIIIPTMAKKEIHPEYFPEATVKCACGNSFKVGATKKEIHVEVCSKCHPFYTGEEKLMDTAGRVEKFKARKSKADATLKVVKKVRTKKTK